MGGLNSVELHSQFLDFAPCRCCSSPLDLIVVEGIEQSRSSWEWQLVCRLDNGGLQQKTSSGVLWKLCDHYIAKTIRSLVRTTATPTCQTIFKKVSSFSQCCRTRMSQRGGSRKPSNQNHRSSTYFHRNSWQHLPTQRLYTVGSSIRYVTVWALWMGLAPHSRAERESRPPRIVNGS